MDNYALIEFIFVCDYSPPWAYECLDGWCSAGECFSGYLTVSLTVLKRKKKKKTYQEDSHDTQFASFGSGTFPWLGVNMN